MTDPQTALETLDMPLPADILRCREAGYLEEALQAIRCRMDNPLTPERMKTRLWVEQERIRRLPTQYPYGREEAFGRLETLLPGLTQQEFDRLEREGKLDYIFLRGEKRYFVRFHRSAVKGEADLALRTAQPPTPHSPLLDPLIDQARTTGQCGRRFVLRHTLWLEERAFVPGTYRAWLPLAARTAQQENIQVLAGNPDRVLPLEAPVRTVFWQRSLEAPQPFCVEYAYTARVLYADPLHSAPPPQPLYPAAPAPTGADLAEQLPHLRFTPFLRDLCARLTGGEHTPEGKAWRIYDYITQNIHYAFVRDYFQIDDLAQYCALNGRGDCGLQALLMIALLRIAGIPARWQSGMSLDNTSGGSHDWLQFYLDRWGWLFADPSYGGGAYRCGSEARQAYYFGNVDPFRMASNSVFQGVLEPAMTHFRCDPYDSQSGEMERLGAEYAFTPRQLDDRAEVLSVSPVEQKQ